MGNSLWKICCSLKLAIVLASLATFLLMMGSLLFPGHPVIFDQLDSLPLNQWLTKVARPALHLSWWFYLFMTTMIALLVNTACCFTDWLFHLQSRWKKLGEYAIHLGVVLLLVGFTLAAVGGWRHIALPCTVGELTALPQWPGHYIIVDHFKPIMSESGRPLDMVSRVRVMKGEQQIAAGEVRINQPLLFSGVVITPASFGQKPKGFSFILLGKKQDLYGGQKIALPRGMTLEVLRFYADVRINDNNSMSYRNDRLNNPAMEIVLKIKGEREWRGWYFLKQAPPSALKTLNIRPFQPLYTNYSSLTINYDPGIRVTATGGILIAVGCFIALFSFYRKRRRQDRPIL